MNENKKIFNSKQEALYFIVGFIAIMVIIFIALNIGVLFIDISKKFISAYPELSVAMLTGLLAFISVIVGKYFENRYIIKNKIREERQKIYTEFLDWLIENVLYAEISNNDNIEPELKKMQKNMTIYASDKVLKAWSKFKDIAMNSDLNKKRMNDEQKTKFYIKNEAPYIEKLILAIRKDLGYKNKNIKQYDILKLYIGDLNKYL